MTTPIQSTDNSRASFFATICSNVFSPLIVPLYATIISFWATYLMVAPLKTRVLVTIAVAAFSCVLPLLVILFLKAIKIVKSADLTDRHERPIPYSVATVCYVGLWLYLNNINAPQWFSSFFLASAIAAVINLAINFKWKISGHATGIGGLTMFCFFIYWKQITFIGFPTWFIVMILISGFVLSSRLILQRHTVGQLVAGYLTGCVTVALTQLL